MASTSTNLSENIIFNKLLCTVQFYYVQYDIAKPHYFYSVDEIVAAKNALFEGVNGACSDIPHKLRHKFCM